MKTNKPNRYDENIREAFQSKFFRNYIKGIFIFIGIVLLLCICAFVIFGGSFIASLLQYMNG